MEVRGRKGKVNLVDQDEPIRATFENGSYTLTTSLDRLALLPPAFEKDGHVTAGNAPGLNDGAAALVVTSRAEAQRQGIQTHCRVVGYTHAAVDPQWIFRSARPRYPLSC